MNIPDLDTPQIQIFVQGMGAIAHLEDRAGAKAAMLRGYYETWRIRRHCGPPFAALAGTEFSPARARHILGREEQRHEFIRACLFIAYADDHYSAAEQGKIAWFAEALEVPPQTLDSLETVHRLYCTPRQCISAGGHPTQPRRRR